MTHKLPQGIDAGLRDVLSETADQLDRWANESRNGGWSTHQVDPMRRKADELRRALAAAPPDPRKDLAALEEAARKVELSVEEVRQLTLKSWPREHSNPPDVEEWRATIAALIRNNIDLKYALAEMRGAKRGSE